MSRKRTKWAWWAPPAVVAMAVGFFVVQGPSGPFNGTAIIDGDTSVFVWSSTVDRSFERVPNQTTTSDADGRIERVACVAYEGFTHQTIDRPNARVLDDESLYRSAELLSGEFAASSTARRIEDERVRRGLSPTAATLLIAGLDLDPAEEAEAHAYLVALREPPSPASFQEFVVFETLETRTSTKVVRLGGLDLDPGFDFGRTSFSESRVETIDGAVFSVPADRCDDGYGRKRLQAWTPVLALVVVVGAAIASSWFRRRQREDTFDR